MVCEYKEDFQRIVSYIEDFQRIVSYIEDFLYTVAVIENNIDEEGYYHLSLVIGCEDVEICFSKCCRTPVWVLKPSWASCYDVAIEDEIRLLKACVERLHRIAEKTFSSWQE